MIQSTLSIYQSRKRRSALQVCRRAYQSKLFLQPYTCTHDISFPVVLFLMVIVGIVVTDESRCYGGDDSRRGRKRNPLDFVWIADVVVITSITVHSGAAQNQVLVRSSTYGCCTFQIVETH